MTEETQQKKLSTEQLTNKSNSSSHAQHYEDDEPFHLKKRIFIKIPRNVAINQENKLTRPHLQDLCENYGRLKNCEVKGGGGLGFATYETHEDAAFAITKLQEKRYRGNLLNAGWAAKKKPEEKAAEAAKRNQGPKKRVKAPPRSLKYLTPRNEAGKPQDINVYAGPVKLSNGMYVTDTDGPLPNRRNQPPVASSQQQAKPQNGQARAQNNGGSQPNKPNTQPTKQNSQHPVVEKQLNSANQFNNNNKPNQAVKSVNNQRNKQNNQENIQNIQENKQENNNKQNNQVNKQRNQPNQNNSQLQNNQANKQGGAAPANNKQGGAQANNKQGGAQANKQGVAAQSNKQGGAQANKQTEDQANKPNNQANKQGNNQANKQGNNQANNQANKQGNNQANKQSNQANKANNQANKQGNQANKQAAKPTPQKDTGDVQTNNQANSQNKQVVNRQGNRQPNKAANKRGNNNRQGGEKAENTTGVDINSGAYYEVNFKNHLTGHSLNVNVSKEVFDKMYSIISL